MCGIKFFVSFPGEQNHYLCMSQNIYDENNQIIASISRELLHLSDHYVIDIENEEDVLYVLMLVVAIDAERCTAARTS